MLVNGTDAREKVESAYVEVGESRGVSKLYIENRLLCSAEIFSDGNQSP